MTEDELLEEDEKEVVGLYRATEDMFFGSRQENVCFWTAAHALAGWIPTGPTVRSTSGTSGRF